MRDSPPVFRRGRFGVAKTGVVEVRWAGYELPTILSLTPSLKK